MTPANDPELAWREKQRRLAEARARLLAAKNSDAPAALEFPTSSRPPPQVEASAPPGESGVTQETPAKLQSDDGSPAPAALEFPASSRPPPQVEASAPPGESGVTQETPAKLQSDDGSRPLSSARAPRTSVKTIGAELGETNYIALRGIDRLLRRYGEAFMEEHLVKARAVEASGGMLTATGERRRTFGGTFFVLVKQTIGDKVWRQIIPWQQGARASLPKTEADPSLAPAPRIARPRRIVPPPRVKTAQAGEARTVKVTLIGRPGPITARDTCIETMMENRKAPDLPKGLPALPAEPTRWRVFITKKTWARVEPTLAANADDMLLVEGWGALDASASEMTVYAMTVTTTALQRAAKEKLKPTQGAS